ncbi:MAG TPA: alkaline phosphatase PhoX [candidate division Zixibacteria bacterium]|nr:alkaline phosphatase PhoX [candidate division Zixibacteria bacterium]
MQRMRFETMIGGLTLFGVALWMQPGGALAAGASPRVPTVSATRVLKVVNPSDPDPASRLYVTLDMMDLVKVKGERIVVMAHEIFPSGTQGQQGDIPGFPLASPDDYDGVNRGLGLGAISAWNLKTGEFSFLIAPKNTAVDERYDENKHTSGTDPVKATPWGTVLSGEEWSQAPSATFNTPARAGHILEVDPLRPGALSRIKAMGSFSHEGIAIQRLPANYAIFLGDEQRGGGAWSAVPRVESFTCADGTPRRGGAVYRFIPGRKPEKFGDLQANGGTLAAFDFLARRWLPIPADVVAADNPDVIRCWADTNLSPISLWERPEDFEFDDNTGNLYIAVTEKSCVVDAGRCLVDAAGNTVDAGGNPISFNGARNRAGHVIRLNPDTGDWSVFVDADTVNAQLRILAPVFGNPDNLGLDNEGRVYISQDGGNPNDSLWIATADKNGDGVADHFERLLDMADANLGLGADTGEPTGFLFLDEKTLLLNWQGSDRQDDFGPAPISRILEIRLGGSSAPAVAEASR